MKRKILLIFTLVLCLFLSGCGEEEFIKPTERFFVNDFADVISQSDEDTIFSLASSLDEKTDAQVTVVTIKSLDGAEIADYALQIGREWGVGDEEKDNGIVILLSVNDRNIYIAVGYGLEGALPDSKTGRIIDVYGIEYLKQDDFSTGLAQITKAVVNEIYIEYGLEPDANYTKIDEIQSTAEEETTTGDVISSWITMIIIIVMFSLIFRGRRGFFFFGGPPFMGGGFRGGGGNSFGGGGGFRGGGGSFGGGGAGRRF